MPALDPRHRPPSPGSRRLAVPERSSTGTFGTYDPRQYSTRAREAYTSPRASLDVIAPPYSSSSRSGYDTYSGRPRRQTFSENDPRRTSTTSTTRAPRTTVVHSGRPASPLPREYARDSRDSHAPPASAGGRREVKKTYGVDDNKATHLIDERETKPRRHDSVDRSGHRTSVAGGRQQTYHLNGPLVRTKDIDADHGYSYYTDPATMYRDTEPRWRRQTRGSVDTGRRERPLSLTEDSRQPRNYPRELGPPPSVRGFDKLVPARSGSVHDMGPRSPTREPPVDYPAYRENDVYSQYPPTPVSARTPTTVHQGRLDRDYERDRPRDSHREREREWEPERDRERDRIREPHREREREPYREREREPQRERERELPREPQRELQREPPRERDRDRDREWQRERDREKDIERERDRDKNRDRERGREPDRDRIDDRYSYGEDDYYEGYEPRHGTRRFEDRDVETRGFGIRAPSADPQYSSREESLDHRPLTIEAAPADQRIREPAQEIPRDGWQDPSPRDRERVQERDWERETSDPGRDREREKPRVRAYDKQHDRDWESRRHERERDSDSDRDREYARGRHDSYDSHHHSSGALPAGAIAGAVYGAGELPGNQRDRRYEDENGKEEGDYRHRSQKPELREESTERERHYVQDRPEERSAPPQAVDADEDYRRRIQQELERTRQQPQQQPRDSQVDDDDYNRRREAEMQSHYDADEPRALEPPRHHYRQGSNSSETRQLVGEPDEMSDHERKLSVATTSTSYSAMSDDTTVAPSQKSENRVRIVEPPKSKEDLPQPKGILRKPTVKFPEDPNPIREGVAPLKDAQKKGIPTGARWTKIDRRLVNPEALEEAKERYEERLDCVIVLRVLTKEEIQKFADRTKQIRDERYEHEHDHSHRRDQDRDRDRERDRGHRHHTRRRTHEDYDDNQSESTDNYKGGKSLGRTQSLEAPAGSWTKNAPA